MRITGAFLVVSLLLVRTASAQERFDVFYLAIGSGSYAASPVAGVTALRPIPGAAKSARIVADLFQRGGAGFGITLLSDTTHFVGRDDIVNSLSRLLKEIRTTHPHRPLVVVYFAGHGMSDGMTWDHFSLPGNVVYRGELPGLVAQNTLAMASLTLHAATLVAWLRNLQLPFLILLDTCYEGKLGKFFWDPLPPAPDCSNDISGFCAGLVKQVEPLRKFDEQMKETVKGFNELADGARKVNRFENTYPVVFSAEPGNTVATVADPFNPDPQETAVAPLARRAMLILAPVLRQGQALSLEEFVHQMISPTLDACTTPAHACTSPAVTYSVMPKNTSLLLVSRGSHLGHSESRVGTATAPVICCDDSSALATAPSPVHR